MHQDLSGIILTGHIKISDPNTKEVFVDKRNAIHYEAFSISLAECVSNYGHGWIHELSFGNGGTMVDPTGIITYLTPNSTGSNAGLYNQTYSKIVDGNSILNPDPARNKTEVRHVTGKNYTDVFITCLLDFGEPTNQQAFDNSTNLNSDYTFDEMGLKSYSPTGTGRLLTHVIFHPVQKSLNRAIQVDYTIRISSLSGSM
jgi:hypothetical protein